jgi:TonB-linked SusC/RagA family outer membrane protein
MLFAQAVTGVVTDQDGKKLQSVSVTVPGTSVGTTTDLNGNYKITVPANATELQFSIVGYQPQTVAVSGRNEVNVTLQLTTGALADVVVVGYGTQRKRDVTGTISTVKGDDFKNLPVTNAAQDLQGRASGVDIIRSDGAPGSVPSIRIRGTGTINNSDPLIVIDGVPSGGLNDVNPNDIASIEILKDASSSAIYGTRAANGVVLITTKKGNYGDQLKTSINAYTGWSNPIKYLDLLTAPDLVTLKKELFANDGTPVPAVWNDPYYATQRTDWQKALFETGTVTNADLAIRGGGSNSRYSITGNYYDEKGMIVNSYFKRYSGTLNSEHKLGKRIRVGENFLYSYTNTNAPDTRSTQAGLVWSALRFNPAIPVMNEGWHLGKFKG